MKKHIWVKAGHHMLIAAFGILLPLGAAQADNQDSQQKMQHDRMQNDRSGSTWSNEPQSTPPLERTPPSGMYDNQPSSQGVQGPIRSDTLPADRYEGQRGSSDMRGSERYSGRDRLDADKNRSGRYYDPDQTQKLMFSGP